VRAYEWSPENDTCPHPGTEGPSEAWLRWDAPVPDAYYGVAFSPRLCHPPELTLETIAADIVAVADSMAPWPDPAVDRKAQPGT
jgi:hypothetical protein